MKQQSVVTDRHTVLWKAEKTRPILIRLKHTHDMCLPRYKDKSLFCGQNILTEGVFLSQLSSNAGISVWRIVLINSLAPEFSFKF
jgi:hypothetical protein